VTVNFPAVEAVPDLGRRGPTSSSKRIGLGVRGTCIGARRRSTVHTPRRAAVDRPAGGLKAPTPVISDAYRAA